MCGDKRNTEMKGSQHFYSWRLAGMDFAGRSAFSKQGVWDGTIGTGQEFCYLRAYVVHIYLIHQKPRYDFERHFNFLGARNLCMRDEDVLVSEIYFFLAATQRIRKLSKRSFSQDLVNLDGTSDLSYVDEYINAPTPSDRGMRIRRFNFILVRERLPPYANLVSKNCPLHEGNLVRHLCSGSLAIAQSLVLAASSRVLSISNFLLSCM
jgi:hypothetical protein